MINDLDEDNMLMQSAIAGDSLRLNTYLKSKFYQVIVIYTLPPKSISPPLKFLSSTILQKIADCAIMYSR